MTDPERKRKFAALLLKHPHRAEQHVLVLFPELSTGDAFALADDLSRDPDVLAHVAEMREGGPDAYLTDRDETARDILDIAQDPKIEPKHRNDAYRLYAQLTGQIADKAPKTDDTGIVKELLDRVANSGRSRPSK